MSIISAGVETQEHPPTTFDGLQSVISRHHKNLSRRLQQVAEYVLAHPDDIALETIAVIAERADVPPSSLIRFAKAFGFEGFSEMQRLFRARLLERVPSYGERIRQLRERTDRSVEPFPHLVLEDFASAAINALNRLRENVPAERLDEAIEILAKAQKIYVTAQQRSFAVAAYLSYLLAKLECGAHLLDSVGGMLEQQGRTLRKGDVLLAISFTPYSPETLALVEHCHDKGIAVIGITDNPVSPLARLSKVSFEVVEDEVQGFRSLNASMALALALVVALGHRLASTPSNGDNAPG